MQSSVARRVHDADLDLWIVENAPLERLLFSRNIVGWPFYELCGRASAHFVDHLSDEVDGASELMILSKGLVYQLISAVGLVRGVTLPLNVIATRRSAVSESDAAIEVSYSRFDAGGKSLIIGDTVASGATIVAATRQPAASSRPHRRGARIDGGFADHHSMTAGERRRAASRALLDSASAWESSSAGSPSASE